MEGAMSPIDSAAASVLSSNEVLLAAPNNAKLTALYPTPSECTSVIAQCVNNSGQLYVRSNSLAFGSSSNFQISSANILDSPFLEVELTLPAGTYGICEDGWLFNMIRSIEVSYSNSNLSNLILTSVALRDWCLAQCQNHERRQLLLKHAGVGGVHSNANAATIKASLPLSFLNWGSASLKSGFPFDARTINGIIQIQVNWQPTIDHILCELIGGVNDAAVNNISVPISALPAAVVAFSQASVIFRSYQLMDSAFSVGNALAANPGMRYTIPAKWLNSYKYNVIPTTVDSASGVQNGIGQCRIELTSAPAGMLQGIMLHVRPVRAAVAGGAAFGNADGDGVWGNGKTRVNRMGSLRLAKLKLQYSGQNIVNLSSEEEVDSFMQYIYGDDMKTKVSTIWQNRSATSGSNPPLSDKIVMPNPAVNAASEFAAGIFPQTMNSGAECEVEHQTYIIPLMHDGESVMRGRHFENLPQYSGSALTLEFDTINSTNYYSNRSPNSKATGGVAATAAKTWASGVFGGNPKSAHVAQKIGPMSYATGPATVAETYPAGAYYSQLEVTVTYIIAGLIQNSNGMVELQI